jgi:sortase A
MNKNILHLGAGHAAQTALPGCEDRGGVCFISAHTHRTDIGFKRIGELHVGDEITIDTDYGKFRYRVKGGRVISNSAGEVMRPGGPSVLRLLTCYPFGILSRTKWRYLLEAEPIK